MIAGGVLFKPGLDIGVHHLHHALSGGCGSAADCIDRVVYLVGMGFSASAARITAPAAGGVVVLGLVSVSIGLLVQFPRG